MDATNSKDASSSSIHQLEKRFRNFCDQMKHKQHGDFATKNLFVQEKPPLARPLLRPSMIDRACLKSAFISSTPMACARSKPFTPESSATVSPIDEQVNGLDKSHQRKITVPRIRFSGGEENSLVTVSSADSRTDNRNALGVVGSARKKADNINNLAVKLASSARSLLSDDLQARNMTMNKDHVRSMQPSIKRLARSVMLQTGVSLAQAEATGSTSSDSGASGDVEDLLERCDAGVLTRHSLRSVASSPIKERSNGGLHLNPGVPWRVASGLGDQVLPQNPSIQIGDSEDEDLDETFLPKLPKKRKVFVNKKKSMAARRKSGQKTPNVSRRKSVKLQTQVGEGVTKAVTKVIDVSVDKEYASERNQIHENSRKKERSQKKSELEISNNLKNRERGDDSRSRNNKEKISITRKQETNAKVVDVLESSQESSVRSSNKTRSEKQVSPNKTKKNSVLADKINMKEKINRLEKDKKNNKILRVIVQNNISQEIFNNSRGEWDNQSFDSHESQTQQLKSFVNQFTPVKNRKQVSRTSLSDEQMKTANNTEIEDVFKRPLNKNEKNSRKNKQTNLSNSHLETINTSNVTLARTDLSLHEQHNLDVNSNSSMCLSSTREKIEQKNKKTTTKKGSRLVVADKRSSPLKSQSKTASILENGDLEDSTAKQDGRHRKTKKSLSKESQLNKGRSLKKNQPEISNVTLGSDNVFLDVENNSNVRSVAESNMAERSPRTTSDESQPVDSTGASKPQKKVANKKEKQPPKRKADPKPKKQSTKTTDDSADDQTDNSGVRRSSRQRRPAPVRSVGFILCTSEHVYKSYNPSGDIRVMSKDGKKKKVTTRKRQTTSSKSSSTVNNLSPIRETSVDMQASDRGGEFDSVAAPEVDNVDSVATTDPDVTNSSAKPKKKNSVLKGRVSKKRKTVIDERKLRTSIANTLSNSQAEETCNILSIQKPWGVKVPEYEPLKNMSGVSLALTEGFPTGMLKIAKGKTKPKQSLTQRKLSFTVVQGLAEVGLNSESSKFKKFGIFTVPVGCEYYIKNLSKKEDLILTFTKLLKD